MFGRHPKATVAAVVVLALTPVWVSAGEAATNPAQGSTVGSRLTEWVRDHGGGGIVTWAENEWYSHHPPPKGGRPPKGAIPTVATSTSTVPPTTAPAETTTTAPPLPPHLALPPPVTPLASPALNGEGVWHPIGREVDGLPTVEAAYLRPNDVNTSLVAGVAWMDTKLLRATLYEGASIPGSGGPWTNMAPLQGAALDTLTAAFNSGFRMQDARGGFYADGQTAIPLVNGGASLVIDSNGTASVGEWGRDFTMGPDIAAVRQNLALIVDGGQVVPGLNANDNLQWGATLGGKVQVWRSGLGETAEGALVYVGGSGLSIVDLANLLQHAGAVRAMELDINTDWVNFFAFAPPPGQQASPANGTKLTSDEESSVSRYFVPCDRDFVTMSVRP